MAGRGSRFSDVGYSTPKPLIEVNGRPMIFHAFQSVKEIKFSKVIFITLREHQELYDVSRILKEHVIQDFELIQLDGVTEGQLCTVLTAKEYFKSGESLLIAASDSYVENNIFQVSQNSSYDGVISVINLPGDQWSFAKTDDNGLVTEVSEKVRISDHASTGLYYFRDSGVFCDEAEEIVRNREKTKGEYYIMPVYNKLITKRLSIGISEAKAMWDMGTPEAKEKFEKYLNQGK